MRIIMFITKKINYMGLVALLLMVVTLGGCSSKAIKDINEEGFIFYENGQYEEAIEIYTEG